MLVEHAEQELRAAGLFDKNSDYDGLLGDYVMELVRVFAAQGHSGGSAALTVELFSKVASYETLTPLRHPLETGEWMDVSGAIGRPCYQSTRRHSVFSEDGGKTWYNIDKRVPWYKRLFGVRRYYINFAE